jgi:hypothetical protein
MEDLIKALQIFLKYRNETWPTHCEHDIFLVLDITKEEVSEEDSKALHALGFFWSKEHDSWASFRYGSN